MSTSHNHAPATSVELTDSEKDLLSVERISEWRKRQYDTYSQMRADAGFAPDGNYTAEFDSSIDDSLLEYLSHNGVDATSPHYAEIASIYREASIDNITEDEWGNSPASRGVDPSDTKSQREIFAERLDQFTVDSQDDDGSDVDMDALHGEALLDNARFDVDASRDAWATVSAKRQGRAFDVKDKNRDTVRDTYHDNVRKLGVMELQDEVLDTDDDAAKNAKVIEYLFKEQAKLRELTTLKLQGTKVGRFVKMMNKGSLGVRLAKGFGVGLVVGAGGALVLGAAGAAGGAALAIGASRFVKGYASNDRHRGMKTAQEEFIDSNSPVELENTEHDSLEKRFDDTAGSYNESFEDDTKKEQMKRRKAFGAGVISVAAGAGVGYAIVAATDHGGAVVDAVRDWWNGPDAGIDARDTETDGTFDDRDGDGIRNGHDLTPDGVDAPELDRDGDGVRNWLDSDPDNPAVSDGDTLGGRSDMFDGYMGTRSLTPEAIGAMHEQLDGYTVKPGDSVWSISEGFLHKQGIAHPTVYEIDATKDVLLKELRAEGLVDAKGWLSVGDTLHIK